jgi:hypothetical protein
MWRTTARTGVAITAGTVATRAIGTRKAEQLTQSKPRRRRSHLGWSAIGRALRALPRLAVGSYPGAQPCIWLNDAHDQRDRSATGSALRRRPAEARRLVAGRELPVGWPDLPARQSVAAPAALARARQAAAARPPPRSVQLLRGVHPHGRLAGAAIITTSTFAATRRRAPPRRRSTW